MNFESVYIVVYINVDFYSFNRSFIEGRTVMSPKGIKLTLAAKDQ